MFMKAVEILKAAGAEVVVDDSILPTSFARMASRVATYAYMQDGTNRFLAVFGPAEYHSAAEYSAVNHHSSRRVDRHRRRLPQSRRRSHRSAAVRS
jgi:hypothetical protein